MVAGIDLLTTSQSIKKGFYNSAGYASISPDYIGRIYQYPLNKSRIKRRSIWPETERARELSSTIITMKDNYVMGLNKDALQRVMLFRGFEVIEDEEKALRRLMDPSFDIHNKIILLVEPTLTIKNVPAKTHVVIAEEKPEYVKIKGFSSVNGLLLLSDTFHEGWKAYLDSKEVKIMRANYAFRAVEFPAGLHIVEFVFLDPWLKKGMAISMIFLTLFLIVAASLLYKRKN
jgi:hypothetical protein